MMRPMPPERPDAAVLSCAGLRKSFGDRMAVDGVGFRIGPSETYGLLGPNGAGKTTTISMICGLLVRDGGEVEVAGNPVDVDAVEAKAHIGYVPQDLAIYPELSARENLRFFGRLYGLNAVDLKARIAEVLETIGLEHARLTRQSIMRRSPCNPSRPPNRTCSDPASPTRHRSRNAQASLGSR